MQELTTGAEVLQNAKAVKLRLRSLKPHKPPAPPVVDVEQRPPETVIARPLYPTCKVIYFSPPMTRPYVVFGSTPPIGMIIDIVSHFYQLPSTDILSTRRMAEIVRARHIAMYLARELTKRSTPEIGRAFDGRDHTTVLFVIRKMERLLLTDERLKDELEILRIKIAEAMRGAS